MTSTGATNDQVRVGFDATPLLGQRTGVGHAAAALLEALARRDDLDLTAYGISWKGRDRLAVLVPDGVEPRTRPIPARLTRAAWRRFDRPRIERWTGPVDVVHATNFVAPPTEVPCVVTVHDLTCVRFPEMCSADTLAYPALIRSALRRGAVVHVVSDTVGEEVREEFGLDAERLVRIHPGTFTITGGDAAIGRRLAGRDRYVLGLGTIEPRKNLTGLVAAFDAVAADDETLGLVLAGPDGWGADEVSAAIDAASARARIVRTGYVDGVNRAHLLAGAAAFAFPSRYEGFGHPPLEAMSAGVPVVATAAGSLPEVLGDAAHLVPVEDIDALAGGLQAVLTDEALRAELIGRGHERVGRYSWERSAQETADLYRRLATGGPTSRGTRS